MENNTLSFIDPGALVRLGDKYKLASNVEKDTTVSYRLFDDSKKLTDLRSRKVSLTVDRYNDALRWFAENWPRGADFPAELVDVLVLVSKPREMGEAVGQ